MSSSDGHGDRLHPTDLRESSLHLLEFHQVRERLADYATFTPAEEMARQLTPSYHIGEVVRGQQETTEARRFLLGGSTLELSEARDLHVALQRAALGGVLTGEELRDVHDTLKATRGARAALLRQKSVPALEAIARDLPVLQEMEKELARAIGPHGEVLDSASPTLKELRDQARFAYQSLTESLERTIRRVQRHNILQEPLITQRNGRMVLLLKSEMKGRLPGIVHDVSDSGATIFVEPMAAITLGNEWRELRLAVEREEERVVRTLSDSVETYSGDLLGGQELLSRLDMAMAKARYALATDAAPPTMVEGEQQYVSLTDARHPMLHGEVVPISVNLGEGSPVLLITGPNAGGKTVALKTVGLLSLMAQAGLHIPARKGTLSLFDGVYTDIGDQQSIQRSVSTFSSHIENLRAITEEATDRSLVLIDELGTSTDPEEGAALAKAILDHFFQRGITLMATTHHREVAAYVQEHPGMVNASVELDPDSLAPTYRLSVGLPGRSYALTIAAWLGLESGVVERARDLLSPVHRKAESLLKELQEERHLAAEQRREAQETLALAEKERAALEEQLASVKDSKAEMMEEARHQLKRSVDEIVKRLRAAELAAAHSPPRMAPPVVGQSPPSSVPSPGLPPPGLKEARKELAQVRRELRSTEWQPPSSGRRDWISQLRSGDRVYVRGVPQPVEVITPPGDEDTVEVLLGTMRARLPNHQLARLAAGHTIASGDGIRYSRRSKKSVGTEMDLHGTRVEEALDMIDGFLNDATMAGLPSVRVMHGVGSGALRSAIREYLSHHPLARSFGRDENLSSDSVTVVYLN